MKRYGPYLDWIDSRQDHMVARLVEWAEINSGSYNLEGLERMLSALSAAFQGLGGRMERIELAPHTVVDMDGRAVEWSLGSALSVRKLRDERPRVFLCIHMDTVYGVDHEFQRCSREGENRLCGPGVADAKGGIMVMLTALEALERSPWADGVSWEILLNPDEEIGSPGSAPLLEQTARDNDIGLAFEPALLDGSLVGERPGSGGVVVVMRGRAAHAGRDPHLGRNAINALAEFIVELNTFPAAHPGSIVNVGTIKGGGPVNIVPDLAVCRFNVRVSSDETRRTFEVFLAELASKFNAMDGISIEVHGRFARAPKPVEGRTVQLMERVVACADELGLPLQWRPSGGASDGNNLVAAGLPTVDSLGVRGGSIHSSDEFVFVDSIAERARLTALFLMKLGAGDMAIQE